MSPYTNPCESFLSEKEFGVLFHYTWNTLLCPPGPFLSALHPLYKALTGHSSTADLLCDSYGGFQSMLKTFECHGITDPFRTVDICVLPP